MFSSFEMFFGTSWLPWLRLCTSNGVQPSGEPRNPAAWCSFKKKSSLILYSQKKFFSNVLNNVTWWYYCSHFKDKGNLVIEELKQHVYSQEPAWPTEIWMGINPLQPQSYWTSPSLLHCCTPQGSHYCPKDSGDRSNGADTRQCKHTSPHCPVVLLSEIGKHGWGNLLNHTALWVRPGNKCGLNICFSPAFRSAAPLPLTWEKHAVSGVFRLSCTTRPLGLYKERHGSHKKKIWGFAMYQDNLIFNGLRRIRLAKNLVGTQ